MCVKIWVDLSPEGVLVQLAGVMSSAFARVQEACGSISLVNGELFSEVFFQNMAMEVNELMRTVPALEVNEIARQFAIPADQAATCVHRHLGTVIQGMYSLQCFCVLALSLSSPCSCQEVAMLCCKRGFCIAHPTLYQQTQSAQATHCHLACARYFRRVHGVSHRAALHQAAAS